MNYEGYRLVHARSLLSDCKEIKFQNTGSDWFFYKVDSKNIKINFISIDFRSLHQIECVVVNGSDEDENVFDKVWRSEELVPLSIKALAWELLREFYATGIMN